MRSRMLIMLTVLAISVWTCQSVGQGFSAKASKIQVETCDAVDNFQDCHDNYPTGCSFSDNPRYDAYLNYLKNQTPDPVSSSTRRLELGDFADLEQQIPDTLASGNHADHAAVLEQIGEGQINTVVGFLYYAEDTGKSKFKSRKGETTNCQLVGTSNADFHLAIGFDPNVASKAADKSLRHGGEGRPPGVLEQTSIIVEMTPHYRAAFHPNWTFSRVAGVAGSQVKVVGQLIADNEHVKATDDCGNPNADESRCWRASIWEIHPVTQFLVCTGQTPCDPDSDQGWQKLDDQP